MKKIVKSKYRCMNENCKFEFSKKNPGQVTCHKCGSIYVEWLNHKEVIESLGDYGRA